MKPVLRSFIPASKLTEWRRQTAQRLLQDHLTSYERDRAGKVDDEALRKLLPEQLGFTANVANHLAEKFYHSHGTEITAPAFELNEPKGETIIMTCRHCIRHALGLCLKQTGGKGPKSLALRLPDGQTFPLRFDCRNCEMQVLKK